MFLLLDFTADVKNIYIIHFTMIAIIFELYCSYDQTPGF